MTNLSLHIERSISSLFGSEPCRFMQESGRPFEMYSGDTEI